MAERWVECPMCGGSGEGRELPPVTVGEPQPGEMEPCTLCQGLGQVRDTWLQDWQGPMLGGVGAGQAGAATRKWRD
jgi:hypothetical protein